MYNLRLYTAGRNLLKTQRSGFGGLHHPIYRPAAYFSSGLSTHNESPRTSFGLDATFKSEDEGHTHTHSNGEFCGHDHSHTHTHSHSHGREVARARVPIDKPTYNISFTCKMCNTRSSHFMSHQAYHNGTVLIKCPECKNRHLIADHLKIFSDTRVTIEDIVAKDGQVIWKGGLHEYLGDTVELTGNDTPSS
ncbi:DNL zinc finger-domain-containing protein [Lipomyces arxii]|uniref:DNL zinc finger-domain-containing protein n=1 Tax=Lipomyces arxii TaxID=56418 RepID=UPI0034CDF970